MAQWEGKTRGGTWGYLFFIFIIKRFGVSLAYFILKLVVIYFIPFAPKATRSIWFYARNILKLNRRKSIVLLIKNYYRLGQTLIDKIAIGNGMNKKYDFKLENYDKFLEILNSDQGVIIIGAHIGNWEIGTPFFDEYGKKINVVMFDGEYQKIKDILNKNTNKADFKVIPIKDDLSSILAIKEALDNKEYVCFQGDRFLNEGRYLEHSFIGKTARFPSGLFTLAAKLRVPVVFYFAMREQKRAYRFNFTIADSVNTIEKRVSEQDILEEYIMALENILKQYPEQWFNYYQFWQKEETENIAKTFNY